MTTPKKVTSTIQWSEPKRDGYDYEAIGESIIAVPDDGTAGFANSETPGTADPAPRRGGRPKDPNAKTVQQIALRPADWEYAALWAIDSRNVADNASTRMERMISRLRSMAPKGPDAFGFDRDPTKALKPRRTPAIAREARRRGMETAELENEMWALYKAQKESKG